MKSTDEVGVTFVNLMLGRGILNGVVNVTLGVYEFNPDLDGEKVDPAPAIASRLRMDVPWATSRRREYVQWKRGLADEPAWHVELKTNPPAVEPTALPGADD